MRHYPPGRRASVRQRSDNHLSHCSNNLQDIRNNRTHAHVGKKKKTHGSFVNIPLHVSCRSLMN